MLSYAIGKKWRCQILFRFCLQQHIVTSKVSFAILGFHQSTPVIFCNGEKNTFIQGCLQMLTHPQSSRCLFAHTIRFWVLVANHLRLNWLVLTQAQPQPSFFRAPWLGLAISVARYLSFPSPLWHMRTGLLDHPLIFKAQTILQQARMPDLSQRLLTGKALFSSHLLYLCNVQTHRPHEIPWEQLSVHKNLCPTFAEKGLSRYSNALAIVTCVLALIQLLLHCKRYCNILKRSKTTQLCKSKFDLGKCF